MNKMNHPTKPLKRVLLLCDFFNTLGGTEYYNAALAEGLTKRGIEVKIYVGEKPHLQYWNKFLDSHHIFHKEPSIHHEDLSTNVIEKEFMASIVEEINDWNPDIIHVYPFKKMAIAWLNNPNSNKNIPIVSTEWTTPSKNTSHWFDNDLAKHIGKVHTYIATGEAIKKGLREYHKYDGNILVIPHLLKPSQKMGIHTEKTHNSVGCISRLSVEKGLDFLIGGWKKVNEKCPNATLHIYGHGPELEHLTTLRDSLGLRDVISFEGIFQPYTGIDDVAEKHSIFVQPSLFESIPTSLTELMLRGRVMIASRVGGVPEILNAGNGILVNPGSTDEISESLLHLFSSLDNIIKLGVAAYESAIAKYNYENILTSIINLYRSIINEDSRNRDS